MMAVVRDTRSMAAVRTTDPVSNVCTARLAAAVRTVRLASAVAAAFALFALAICLAMPARAWAVQWAEEGEVLGYAYLEKDGTLVVQADQRKQEVKANYTSLGAWRNSESSAPWSNFRSKISAVKFKSLKRQPTGNAVRELFSKCRHMTTAD